MLNYYDIAFCRTGPTTRDRQLNLIADASSLTKDEFESSLRQFYNKSCPLKDETNKDNRVIHSYHTKYGCRYTKIKPIRIYAEIVDLLIFKDGYFINVG